MCSQYQYLPVLFKETILLRRLLERIRYFQVPIEQWAEVFPKVPGFYSILLHISLGTNTKIPNTEHFEHEIEIFETELRTYKTKYRTLKG